MLPHSPIRIPEGYQVLDLRPDGIALPQTSFYDVIACIPSNWRDLYGRAVYSDERGNEFCVERRHGGLYPCIYLVHPVETEEDAEQEPFVHTLDEMEVAYA